MSTNRRTKTKDILHMVNEIDNVAPHKGSICAIHRARQSQTTTVMEHNAESYMKIPSLHAIVEINEGNVAALQRNTLGCQPQFIAVSDLVLQQG
jgi:hypothetical protein